MRRKPCVTGAVKGESTAGGGPVFVPPPPDKSIQGNPGLLKPVAKPQRGGPVLELSY